MDSSSSVMRTRTIGGAVARGIVIALLVLIAAQLFLSTRQESQTFDESIHLYAGFEYWKHRDFGRNPEHPPLAKMIAAAPLLPLALKEPAPIAIPYFKAQDFRNASQFLYSNNISADSLLARGRTMISLFTLVLAYAVFTAGAEMFGLEVGLLALTLFAFEPVFLANGALITTDVPLTCLFFISVYTFYRYVKRPTGMRIAACAAATALVPVVKHSGALIFPTLAVLAVLEIWQRQKQQADDISPARSLRRDAASLAAALGLIAVVSYVVLWAFYGFRYAARPHGLAITPTLDVYMMMLSPMKRAVLQFFAHHHLFPEAYLYGWADILQIADDRISFVFGKIYPTGQWFFFPAMLLVKSTLTLLILLALVPFAKLWRRSREFIFLATPAVIYLVISIVSKLNLGVRHILPVYPFFILLAAAAGWELAQRSRRLKFALAALVLFAAASSLHSFPDYLAYSNEAFGGPSHTYRVVTDSNAEWGQELQWVKRYLDTHQIKECWFDYSSPLVDPKYYGIGCKPLPSAFVKFRFPAAPIPSTIRGTVLVSATELEGVNWGPRSMNPYQQFQSLRPDAEPGNVVLVYHGDFQVPLLAAYSHSATATTLASQGNFPAALAEAHIAVQLAPDSPEMQAALGQVLMMSGQTKEGMQAFSTALQLARTSEPQYRAGMIRRLEKIPNIH